MSLKKSFNLPCKGSITLRLRIIVLRKVNSLRMINLWALALVLSATLKDSVKVVLFWTK
jgi:hypothetical protein